MSQLILRSLLTPEQQVMNDQWKPSERELINFHDVLLSSDVSHDITYYRPPCREQERLMSKKCIYIKSEDVENDLLDLVICVNRHQICKVGSCKNYFNNKLGECRFKFCR